MKNDLGNFYKKNENSKIWWYDNLEEIGKLEISFDKEKIYNLWVDYPYKFSEEELNIFKEEEPYWYDFFSNRR